MTSLASDTAFIRCTIRCFLFQDSGWCTTGSRAGFVEGQSTWSPVQVSDHTRGVWLRESQYWWRRWVEIGAKGRKASAEKLVPRNKRKKKSVFKDESFQEHFHLFIYLFINWKDSVFVFYDKTRDNPVL